MKFFDKIFIKPAKQINCIFSFFNNFNIFFSSFLGFLNLNILFLILNSLAKIKPFAFEVLEIIRSIVIGDFLILENFILEDNKLLLGIKGGAKRSKIELFWG